MSGGLLWRDIDNRIPSIVGLTKNATGSVAPLPQKTSYGEIDPVPVSLSACVE